ncbi:MAG: PaaI family thioesterase [Myxococcaceae bacterium]
MSHEFVKPLTPPPVQEPESDWIPIEPLASVGNVRSFVSGDPNGDRLRVSYFRRGQDAALVGKIWFGPGAEGPPGHAHGGSMAAVLDEAMGAAAWMAGHTVVAAKLTTNFRRMLPLGSEVLLETWVEPIDGKKVRTRGRLFGQDGEAFAEGEGLFIVLEAERFGPLIERAFQAFEKVVKRPAKDDEQERPK